MPKNQEPFLSEGLERLLVEDSPQQPDKLINIIGGEWADSGFINFVDRCVHRRKQSKALICDRAVVDPAVLRTALPDYQVLDLKPIKQPGDPRSLFDHALGNPQDGERFTRPTQNAQDVVLLDRNTIRLNDRCHAPADQVGRLQEANRRFLAGRGESHSPYPRSYTMTRAYTPFT